MKKKMPKKLVLFVTVLLLYTFTGTSLPAGDAPVPYRIVDLKTGEVTEQAQAPTDLLTNDTYKETKMVFRHVPAGVVVMNEGRTTATLTRDFWLGVFECTQAQFETIMDENPSMYPGPHRPVDMGAGKRGKKSVTVRGGTWPDGEPADDSFMAKLRTLCGGKYKFDLPTDVQWEHACRAGTTTDLNTGKDLAATQICPNMDAAGRYDGNLNDGKGGFTQHTKVGSYAPNAWGLYDMHGNIAEQCLDWWYHLPKGEITDFPGNKGQVSGRIVRGGSWRDGAFFCTSAVRATESNGSSTGFRVTIQP